VLVYYRGIAGPTGWCAPYPVLGKAIVLAEPMSSTFPLVAKPGGVPAPLKAIGVVT